MKFLSRAVRWTIFVLLGILLACALMALLRPESCRQAEWVESCSRQWSAACANLAPQGAAAWRKPSACVAYNYVLFFGVVFAVAGLVFTLGSVGIYLFFDRVVELGVRWVSLRLRRRI